MKRLRPQTRLTQTGIVFVIIVLLVQTAAFTTGENLVYLLSAGVASLLILSTVLTRLTLRHVSVTREVSATVERGIPFRSDVRITNGKRLLPTLSVQVSGGNVEGETSRHIGAISAGQRLPIALGHLFTRRGVQALPPVQLNSGFPLGLFRTVLTYDDRAEVTVLPRIHKLKPAAVHQLDGSGERTRRDLGEGDEFFSLRDYVPGDDVRRIAWKVSARVGRFVVRELEPTVARNVVLYFDTRLPAGAAVDAAALPPEVDEAFEAAVDLVASLAAGFLQRQYALSVVTPDERIGFGDGRQHCDRILRMLAGVTPLPHSEESWPARLDDAAAAAAALISADASQWGGRIPGLRSRVLNPYEVTYA